MKHFFSLNDLVFWTDPDNGFSSGEGTITAMSGNDRDSVISLRMKDGGEAEVLPHEIRIVRRVWNNS